MTIELTVGLPMFRAKDTAWLALESLCRQTDIDFEWELTITEEQDEGMFGYDRAMEYYDRLMDIGCRAIMYHPIPKWKPLSWKWRMMGKHCMSKVFCLCGADDWNSPRRLAEAYDMIINHGADWTQTDKGYFYHLPSKEVVMFDGTNYARNLPINPLLQKSLKTKYMRDLPDENVSSKLDTWLMEKMVMQNPRAYIMLNQSEDWKGALYTYGANAISARDHEIVNREPPFRDVDDNVVPVIPQDIRSRLDNIRLYSDSERIGGGWEP